MVLVLCIQFPLLAELQCIDLCMMVVSDFSSIMLTVLSYLNVTIENINIALKALVGNNGATLCLVVIQI